MASAGEPRGKVVVVSRSRPRRSIPRRLWAFGTLLLLGLVFPASALAHTGTAQVSCTGADFNWTLFAPGNNTVHWRVTVDGVTAQEGTTQLTADGGRSGSQHVPLNLNDTHTVAAFSWWNENETSDGNVRLESSPALAKKKLVCPAAPPVTPPPTTPPPTTVTPPAPVTPATPAAPVAQTAPAQAVAGAQAASASARLAAQSTCARRTVRITVSGRQIRSVTFSVAGRRVRTVTVRAGQRSLTVNLPVRSFGARRQSVTARVTFRNGAAARTLTASATRCAQAAVQPQFTG
jgi:hypothetical protein